MMAKQIQYYWSDAWLLLAIELVARDHPATLEAVISMADALQRAIPTKDEMDGALSRLQRAGYIQFNKNRLSLLPLGSQLFANARSDSHREQQQALESELQAVRWSSSYHPAHARNGEPDIIPHDVWDQLMSRYRR